MTTPIHDSPVQGNGAITRHEPREQQLVAAAGGDVTAGQMIMFAIERGASIETMEKLVALKERIEDRDASKAFAQAMADFQAECPLIRKTSKAKIPTAGGGSYSYTYAELDEIVATIAPYVKKHGFAYTWDTRVEKDGMMSVTIKIRHTAGHSETSSFTLPTDTKSAMSSQQKMAAAGTFAKRQTLIAGFGLTTTDEDTDAVERVDPTPITDDQLTILEDLLKEKNVNRQKLIEHFEAESLAKLPATSYAEALRILQSAKPRKVTS